MSWNSFDKFNDVNDLYLPDYGEGDTIATQIVTAVNKLVYKWFNDGDVYDNTRVGYGSEIWGFANDLSSYANWLYNLSVTPNDERSLLKRIWSINNGREYEDILYQLCTDLLDPDYLEAMNKYPARGSVYDANGPFEWIEDVEEDGEDWDDSEEW